MGRQLPLLNSAQLLELGRPNLTYTYNKNERLTPKTIFPANRFKLQIHFAHLPSFALCANLTHIRCYASLVPLPLCAASAPVPLCNHADRARSATRIEAFREVDVDARDGSLHHAQPVVTYAFPAFADVGAGGGFRWGAYVVRFEVAWLGGVDDEDEEEVEGERVRRALRFVLETPPVEIWPDEKDEESE